MGRRLYVGGLPYETSEEAVREAFAEFGAVDSVTILKDKFTGKSRGFGFVEYESKGDAIAATKAMDGSQFGGRTLKVNEARPLNSGDGRSSGGDRFRDSRF